MSIPSLSRAIARVGFHSLSHVLSHTPPASRRRLLRCLPLNLVERRLPSLLMIEATNSCNLHCPLCPVGAGVMTRPRGIMKIESYRALIREVSPYVSRVIMNFAGETLLHPQIGEMVAFAADNGIAVTLGTNGTIDKSEALLAAGPSEILFALDGTSTATLSQYRRGADFDRVLHNLDLLTTGRGRLNGSAPRIILQFVVMRQNEAEVPKILELARDFAVDEVSLVPVIVNNFFQADHDALIESYLPQNSPVVQYERKGDRFVLRRPGICNWAFQSTVLYNGDVVICCFDYDGRHVAGNAFGDGGFTGVWRSRRYRELRRGILSGSLPLCRQCGYSLVKPERIALSRGHQTPSPGAYERWTS